QRLYRHHGAALLAYARSFLPDASAAEDAVHSVFVKLLGGNVTRPESEAGYLYRAVKNAASNVRRSTVRETPMPGRESWFVPRNGDREAAVALQEALGELPDEQREAVIMRIWSGLTLQEIATATAVPLNTAASRYRYALEKLRTQLAERPKKGRDA